MVAWDDGAWNGHVGFEGKWRWERMVGEHKENQQNNESLLCNLAVDDGLPAKTALHCSNDNTVGVEPIEKLVASTPAWNTQVRPRRPVLQKQRDVPVVNANDLPLKSPDLRDKDLVRRRARVLVALLCEDVDARVRRLCMPVLPDLCCVRRHDTARGAVDDNVAANLECRRLDGERPRRLRLSCCVASRHDPSRRASLLYADAPK